MGILQFESVNCKDCCKCIGVCPVKSIEVKDHHAMPVERDCILCGSCVAVCPQGAKHSADDIDSVRELLHSGRRVIASVAPSYIAYFGGCGFAAFRAALQKLGFADACETAEGAYVVKTAYEELLRQGGQRTVVSSCCPTLNAYVEKHLPEAIPYLAPVITPMQAHARVIHAREPDAAVVFLGPCISKKAECRKPDSGVEYAVTFGDLAAWMQENNVEIGSAPAAEAETEKYISRAFPLAGGILATMEKLPEWSYLAVDGPEDCMRALRDAVEGKLKDCFIEMNFCKDGCVGGLSFRKRAAGAAVSRLLVQRDAVHGGAVSDFAPPLPPQQATPAALSASFRDEQVNYLPPTEQQIAAIFKKMGKESVEDELNCGMCGYPTCRDKAVAVAMGRAEIAMCMPYMKKRAEALSDKIINIAPSAILAVDLELKVQQINRAACAMFSLQPQDILKQPVSRVLDEFDFVDMIANRKTQLEKTAYLAEYDLYVSEAFFFDAPSGVVICIMKNITRERQQHNQLMRHKTQVANLADDIVEKQLRIVHEIASLLGESAAETKVAISELKKAVMLEDEEK